jgi:hypothetical protein
MDSTEQNTASNPWEFLGRQAAIIGRSGETIEKRLNGAEPEQAKGIANGYMRGLIYQQKYHEAYKFMNQGWVRFLLDDPDGALKKRTLEGIVSASTNEVELRGIADHLIVSKYPHLIDIAKAAEEKNPDVACHIYSCTSNIQDSKRVVKDIFHKNRHKGWMMVGTYDFAFQAELIHEITSKDNLDDDDITFIYDKLDQQMIDKMPDYDSLCAMVVGRMAEMHPKAVYKTGMKLSFKDAHELWTKARTSMILQEGITNTDEMLQELNSKERLRDRDGLRELGELLFAQAQKEESTRTLLKLYLKIEEIYGIADLQHPNLTPIRQRLLERNLTYEEARELRATDTEMIDKGIAMAKTHPDKAYNMLRFYPNDARAMSGMKQVSAALEKAGDYQTAYYAEIQSGTPDEKRMARLRKQLIKNSKDRCPHCFYDENGDEGRKQWYTTHGDKMQLEERYNFALKLSQDTDDESYVQPLREQYLAQGMEKALHRFKFSNDQAGIDLLKRKMTEEHPALAEHHEMVDKLLDLYIIKEARTS